MHVSCHSLTGDFDAAYLASLDSTVSAVTGAGMHAVLDPHNYARYSTSGKVSDGGVVGADGSNVTVAHFTDFWTRLATHFKGNDRAVFAVMNEQ
eukprot:gene5031-7875_t